MFLCTRYLQCPLSADAMLLGYVCYAESSDVGQISELLTAEFTF
jgi:hypothetical protein